MLEWRFVLVLVATVAVIAFAIAYARGGTTSKNDPVPEDDVKMGKIPLDRENDRR
ncbi:MAG: hypothetical protein ACREV4_03870 [Gammaproteobacteria bacterium]